MNWAAALIESLDGPPTAGDLANVGSLVRCQVLEWRLARSVFARGVTRAGSGEVKPALAELRQIMKLKASLLRELGISRVPEAEEGLSIRDYWDAEPVQDPPQDEATKEPAPATKAPHTGTEGAT